MKYSAVKCFIRWGSAKFFKRNKAPTSVDDPHETHISVATISGTVPSLNASEHHQFDRDNGERSTQILDGNQVMAEMSFKNQYYATFCVNIIALAHGAAVGWTSPFLPILESDESPLDNGRITKEEASWIGAFLCMGGIIGTFIFGWMADRFGRKISSCVIAFPQLGFWILILFGRTVPYLYAARVLAGLSGGGVFVLIPLYVSEIADDQIRGSLGSIFILCVNAGTLVLFVLGAFLNYYLVAGIMAFFPIVFFITFIFLPETPQFLIRQNNLKGAEDSIRFFRGLDKASPSENSKIKMELEKFTKSLESENVGSENTGLSLKDFTTIAARKSLLIGIVLIALNQFSGCFALINYTASIFAEAGSSLTPNMSAIVIGAIQLAGSYGSTVLVDRMARKKLYIASAFCSGVGLAMMGTHGYLKSVDYDLAAFNWIPIASLSFVIFIASCGLLPLTFVILSETLPQKIRGVGTSICTGIMWSFAFLVIKYYSSLVEIFGIHGCMWIFSGVCFVGVLFNLFFVPETKGKSFEAIMKALEGI